MPLTSYSRTDNIASALSHVLTATGYNNVTGSPFLGSIVQAIQEALMTEYGSLYEIADNIDIGKATGEYLDRWGRFHAEPRSTISYAKDLSLSNCSVYLDPTVTAGEITTLGEGITINNLVLANTSGTKVFEALDQVYIRPDRSEAFFRVVCISPGAIEISPGDLSVVNTNLSDISNVLPSAAGAYTLKGRNRYSISSGVEMASESDYRYTIMKKAESVGLFNESKVNSVMDATDVVKIALSEYRGGANVFIETKTIQNVDAVVAVVRTALRQYRSLGYCINVYPPLLRYLTGQIKVSLKNEELSSTTRPSFLSSFCTSINAVEMGAAVDFNNILSALVTNFSNVSSARMLSTAYGGRTLAKASITQKFNEKVLTSEDRFSIS